MFLNEQLLERVAAAEGYSDPMDFIADQMSDSNTTVVCIECDAIQDDLMEADAENVRCCECGQFKATSVLRLIGMI